MTIPKVTTLLVVRFNNGRKTMPSQLRCSWTNLPRVDEADLRGRALNMLLQDAKVLAEGFTRHDVTILSFDVSIPG
ncbi:hypothetical protein OIE66_30690 [Nonomuraea sp. NBC_01738]|uniref:hypothetical protein n=1 Tax=Nonomuraea sp. NBC_01738 TaxID=2976003 RepID=UPI002E0DAB1F|nr:hypothetical protein OIE66_30690 [Nonomuraea sp. NBC_01738]